MTTDFSSYPYDFYSTTNHLTEAKLEGKWVKARNPRMDAVLVCKKTEDGWDVCCKKLRADKEGDLVVCGIQGIRIRPESKDRDRDEFIFMNNQRIGIVAEVGTFLSILHQELRALE